MVGYAIRVILCAEEIHDIHKTKPFTVKFVVVQLVDILVYCEDK